MPENMMTYLKTYVHNMTVYTEKFAKEIPDDLTIDFYDGYYTGYHKALTEIADCIERMENVNVT